MTMYPSGHRFYRLSRVDRERVKVLRKTSGRVLQVESGHSFSSGVPGFSNHARMSWDRWVIDHLADIGVLVKEEHTGMTWGKTYLLSDEFEEQE